jgi:large subunit ribosomal protein L30
MTTPKKEDAKKPAAAALEEIEKTVGLRPRKAKTESAAAPRREASRPAAKAAPKTSMIRIRQVRSGICAPQDQKLTLRGLGLRRPNQEVVRPDNPAIRGMARKVRHLVEVRAAGE